MGETNYTVYSFYRKVITIIFSYRKLNFARCYTADISSMKYFLIPEFCINVRELDLTSCYWLKSADVRKCVLKLSNLEALYVADTSVHISDIIKTLKALHQVLTVATLFLDIVTLFLRFVISINLGYPTLRMSCSSICRIKIRVMTNVFWDMMPYTQRLPGIQMQQPVPKHS